MGCAKRREHQLDAFRSQRKAGGGKLTPVRGEALRCAALRSSVNGSRRRRHSHRRRRRNLLLLLLLLLRSLLLFRFWFYFFLFQRISNEHHRRFPSTRTHKRTHEDGATVTVYERTSRRVEDWEGGRQGGRDSCKSSSFNKNLFIETPSPFSLLLRCSSS